MGQTTSDTAETARDVVAADQVDSPRLCGRFTNGIDTKSRVVMPAAFRAPFADDGGFITPWRGTSLAAMARTEFDAYQATTARRLVEAGEDADRILSTLWSSTVRFTLDLQGRLVLPEEVRSQVGITDEVRFQGRGPWVELRPGQITADELDERADHLATLAVLQSTYIPELEA
ncbi:MAG: division/cell wall cluster transcriptional repressor MraZ [Iamia sp.]